MTNASPIALNIASLRGQIATIATQHSRDADSICLLAVSKTRSAGEVAEAVAAGCHHIGENYLQEALAKQAELRTWAETPEIHWHFIGPIQSNKTRDIAENFAWVHSVDRMKIARRLSEQRPDKLPPLNICLQVNISGETSKSGFRPEEVVDAAADIIALPQLRLRGLMAIPAAEDDPARQRRSFAKLRALRDTLQKTCPALTLDTLSMGMSGDMAAAIAEGSTCLRIGTAIFGPRRR
ncbi:MAG: YggS family pyridoxal phosphate-dependent enzyme [Spongiibacter sp.]|nr:YggS family pyridoxal phosphate-dependent enzyme [Spongiibacter sp.]